MSKLFNVSGSLICYNNVVWMRGKQKSRLNGEILLEDNKIRGYCDNFLLPKQNRHPGKKDDILFLTGMIVEGDKNNRGAACYVLSNHPCDMPIMFLVRDLNDLSDSSWSQMNCFENFIFQGKANLMLEEQPSFSSKAYEVLTTFSELDETIAYNSDLLYKMDDCKEYVINAMAT